MKKSLVLGAAALAAVAFAGPAPVDAGEVKMGGYYMFRVTNFDNTLTDDAINVGTNADDNNYWVHRLQLNWDFIASPKSHAHMVTRVLNSNTVQGAAGAYATNDTADDDGSTWAIRQAWLETEMWTVGVKVGEMPISLHDDILVNHDNTEFGTIMLSKTFGDTTVVLADVKMDENSVGGLASNGINGAVADGNGNTYGADEDDIDLYVASVLGKTAKNCGNGCISYQLTAAYADAGDASGYGTAAIDLGSDNFWLAGTVGTTWNGIDLTATAIYEDGWDNYATTTQLAQDDFLVALRASGKTSWGSWNGYAVYAGENFNNVVPGEAGWSATWDSGGPGSADLLATWATAGGNGNNANVTENISAVGVGVKFNAAGWTINPMVDFASLTEDTINGNQADSDSAWGATLKLSHKIDQGVTLGLQGTFVDPDETNAAAAGDVDEMHYLSADLKMTF